MHYLRDQEDVKVAVYTAQATAPDTNSMLRTVGIVLIGLSLWIALGV